MASAPDSHLDTEPLPTPTHLVEPGRNGPPVLWPYK
jgi:hypothetical protein